MNNLESFLINLPYFIFKFYNSTFFAVIKFLIGIYCAVLFVNIILLLIQRGLRGDVRDTVYGANIPRLLASQGGKKRLRKKWEKIMSRLDSDDQREFKIAIIEADSLVDDLLKKMKYAGENLSERLDAVVPGQIDYVDEIRKAHEMRNRVIHEDNLQIDRKTAEETLLLFQKFFEYFEVIK